MTSTRDDDTSILISYPFHLVRKTKKKTSLCTINAPCCCLGPHCHGDKLPLTGCFKLMPWQIPSHCQANTWSVQARAPACVKATPSFKIINSLELVHSLSCTCRSYLQAIRLFAVATCKLALAAFNEALTSHAHADASLAADATLPIASLCCGEHDQRTAFIGMNGAGGPQ